MMNFAKDQFGNRIEPFYKGRAICELCEGELYAYGCHGRLRSPDWRHKTLLDCDTWSEGETEWHRSWKAHFSKRWCERAMWDRTTGEGHRADVLCPTGLVLEFQNSHISPNEIEARERFYGKMLWVVNGADFEDRFARSSVLADEHMFLSRAKKLDLSQVRREASDEVERLTNSLQELQTQSDKIEHKRQRDSERLVELRRPSPTVSGILGQVLELGTSLTDVRYQVAGVEVASEEEAARFKAQVNQWRVLRKQADDDCAAAKRLAETPTFGVTGLIKVEYDIRLQHYWEHLRWIPKYYESTNGALVTLGRFQRRTDYLAHKYKAKDNLYLYDPTPKREALLQSALVARVKGEELMTSIEAMILSWLRLRADRRSMELQKLEEKLEEGSPFELQRQTIQRSITAEAKALERAKQQSEADQLEVERATSERAEQIDSLFSDVLRYKWKHKREVWGVCSAPMYFDFDDGYLYRRLDADFVHRVHKSTFIEHLNKVQDVPPCPSERPHRVSYTQARGS